MYVDDRAAIERNIAIDGRGLYPQVGGAKRIVSETNGAVTLMVDCEAAPEGFVLTCARSIRQTARLRSNPMKNLYPRTKLTSLLAATCLALVPPALAVDPPPDGGYPGNNTAEGDDALFSLTTGTANTAMGFEALFSNTTGFENTAYGSHSLWSNTIGIFNTAAGDDSLFFNTTGNNNTAYGWHAIRANTTGSTNTGIGCDALINSTTGSNNIAVGFRSAVNLLNDSNNIDIGNAGVAGDAGIIRIGMVNIQTAAFLAGVRGVAIAGGIPVGVSASGQLGVRSSSARFKEAIKPMDKASEAIFLLQPVTFRYKKALDPEALPQFGLVAEQVAKVDPDLVARDAAGKPYTVRYEEVYAMLLNEFLKEHRKVEEQATKGHEQDVIIAELKSADAKQETTIAQQQEEIAALTAALKVQAAQIQKVSDQLRTQTPAPRVVAND